MFHLARAGAGGQLVVPKLHLGLRVKLLLLIALPLLATFIATSLVTWYITQQIAVDLIHTSWTTDADRAKAIEHIWQAYTAISLSAAVIIALALLTTPLWLREIHQPIAQLKTAAARISSGDLATPVPTVGDDWNDLGQTLEHTRIYLRSTLLEMAKRAKMEAELSAEAQHNNELSILLALSQLLLTTNDEKTILDLTVKTAAELLATDFSSVVLPDPRTDELHVMAVHGWPTSTIGERLGRGNESQTGYTLTQGRPVVVDNYNAPLPFKVSLDPEVTSGLSVSMSHEGRIVGALFVHTRHARKFTHDNIRLLTLVANQAAASLERSHLYAQSVIQANELRTLAQISEALNRAETADITLRLVLTEALKLVNDDQGCIILVEPDDYTLRLYTWLGISDKSVEQFNERRFQKYHGIFARSILHGELVEVDPNNDPQSVNDYADTLLAQKINVPLKTDDKTIGVISLNGLPVNEPARRMLLALADLAATAIAKTRLYERTQVLSITDDLTTLYNRRGFFELGQREFERARRFDRSLAAIMFDIDHFKLVNDTHGHSAGNLVLNELGGLCRAELRDVDLLGRYGGEEFVALLPETAIGGGLQVAERLRRRVAGHVFKTGRIDLNITISLGIAILDGNAQTLTELIDLADQALYAAKRAGRNRICQWTPEMVSELS
jgi:diguanylate cyclase (GGDEF)-like protein